MKYLGNEEVEFIEGESEISKVHLKDNKIIELHKDLVEHIVSEKPNEGTLTDLVSHYLSKKFLIEMAYYDLDFYMTESVGTGIKVLAHNLREDAISKAFDCQGALNIKLKGATAWDTFRGTEATSACPSRPTKLQVESTYG